MARLEPLPALGRGFDACRATHLISGRQEAVTGVRDTVTAPFAAQCPSGKGRGQWSTQSVKRMLTAALFACDAARSDGARCCGVDAWRGDVMPSAIGRYL